VRNFTEERNALKKKLPARVELGQSREGEVLAEGFKQDGDAGAKPAKARILPNVVLVLGSTLACLFLLELGLRILYPFFSNYNLEMWRYFATFKQITSNGKPAFVHYPNREARLYGVDVSTNSVGFRDREFSIEKSAGSKRIMALGDSLVFGWGVAQDETIPKVMEQTLNKESGPCEVINTGVGNYNTSMEVELFKSTGLAFNPDIVVLVFYVNDAEPTASISRVGYALKKHSLLLALFFDNYFRARGKFDARFNWLDYYSSLYAPDAPALGENRRALRELAGICRERNIKLVMASYPELHQLKDYPLKIATDYIAGMASECGALFVDLLPCLQDYSPESLWVSGEDAHGNGKAAKAVGLAISKALMENHLMDASPSNAAR
jgi:lysophospholipase L1-like esterase